MAGKASFMETVKTVLWGMAGIRRKADHERANVNPVHVIIAGLIAAILFILTLVTVVNIVTG